MSSVLRNIRIYDNNIYMNKDKRLDSARKYLVELLKAFGELNIRLGIEVDTDTEHIHKSISTNVKYVLDMAGMPFPFDEAKKKSRKNINKNLTANQVIFIINEALMEYMETYLEEMGDIDPNVKSIEKAILSWINEKQRWLDEMFPNYTGDELIPFLKVIRKIKKKEEDAELDPQTLRFSKALLAEMGYDSIDDMTTIKELFWDMAIRHTPIGIHMKKAIELITTNDLARNYLNSHIGLFNKLMQKRLDDPKLKIEERELRKLYGRGFQSYTQHVTKIKKDAEEKIRDIKRSSGINNKVAKNLRILLENPNSNLMDCYDLTTEQGIIQYLSWYKTWLRPFKQRVVKMLEEQRYTEPGALDLFKQKVEEHNAIIAQITERIKEEKSAE